MSLQSLNTLYPLSCTVVTDMLPNIVGEGQNTCLVVRRSWLDISSHRL